jgi:hypothetical protein
VVLICVHVVTDSCQVSLAADMLAVSMGVIRLSSLCILCLEKRCSIDFEMEQLEIFIVTYSLSE